MRSDDNGIYIQKGGLFLQFRPPNGSFKRLATKFERDKLLFAIDQIMSY